MDRVVMGQIIGIQWLRALAALVVAVGHALHDAKTHALREGDAFERVFWLPWGSGVDLFFVISGFIMVYASERLFGQPGAGAQFLARRVARIVPVYWFFLALALGWMVVSARWLGGKPAPDAVSIAAALGFWPYDTFADGAPRPFYTLGWTLNYEMFFYAVFALFVGAGRGAAIARVSLALVGLVAVGLLVPGLPTVLSVWSKPIVLEFALGMGIALLYRRGLVLPGALRLALALGGLAVLVVDPLASGSQALDWITPNDMLRLVGWGLPAAALVLAASLGPRKAAAPGVVARGLALVGDASYVLYLLHPFVIFGLRRVWLGADLDATFGYWPMIAFELVLAVAASVVLHRLAEVPVTRRLQRLLGSLAGARTGIAPSTAPAPAVDGAAVGSR